MPNPADAGSCYACCLCGRRDPRCLCQPCRRAHSTGGVLAPWVVSLRNEAQRLTARERRLRAWEQARGYPPRRVVSLEALDGAQAG